MAPELFDGVGDHRVDVYALSCLLFEALTGRTPFLAHDLPTMMHAHLTLPVPRATRLRPGLPASVDGVVARGMDKDPERRYARAGELAAAARSALRDAPPRPPARERSTGVPPGGRVRRRLAYATVAVLGVLAVGLVGISVLDERLTVTIRPPGVGAATVGPAQVVDEVDVGESPRNLALSADGRRLYATNRGDDSVSVIDAASGTVVRTVELDAGSGPEGIATVPGTDLAYVVNNGSDTVTVLDSTSGLVQQTILVGGFPTDVAVSPDGATAYVAANAGGQVLAVDAIAVRQTLVTGVAPQSLTVSANGRTAFVTDAGQDVLLVVDTASGTVTGRVPVGRVPDGVALSPDERTAYVANIDDDSLSVVDLATLTVRTSIAVGARPIAVAVHPDGRSAFVTSNESDTLSVIDTGTDRVRQALPVGSLPEAVVVSADGSRVYVVNAGDGTVSIVDPAPG
jgi:serine/threonine-protein kinase